MPDKFGRAGLTPAAAGTVLAPRAAECPVTMEAVTEGVHRVADDDEAQRGSIVAIEVRIQRVHVHENLLMEGTDDHIDPDAWRPLIMSFQKLCGGTSDEETAAALGRIRVRTGPCLPA